MNDELKQDFDSALVKHLLFKSKLRSFLYGSGISESPIRDPEACIFGQWITNVVLKQYAYLPESHELNRQHIRVHQVANRLMDLHQQGHPDEAKEGLSEVNLLADHITQLLRTIEQKVRAAR
ncbi:Chemoreceptor zinc-binding domain-containing protein [Hymenobacter gelipurpurascens]|uniref:Chemoreceptor zinc-binding domain-containing protein n=1 Tax=Hymenobacter gelipurpurascens TaxID=89968 RepID=A0A212U9C5_9BACT|nr:CZB domain-containing protein [Hymenobacter gelipurpurascens]SNC74882.1 Chemoreceptor zinc-binding domain-containing protein [Hymenobacter gelipurpurascens]